MESQSTNIVYLNDDVDYQSLCGSTALASTMARASIPGLRWMVRGGGSLQVRWPPIGQLCKYSLVIGQRGAWGVIWGLTMLITLILCLVYLILQTEDNVTLRKREQSLRPLSPNIFICPKYESSLESRQRVEKVLPVMKYLWDSWNNVMQSKPALDSSMPWRNESSEHLNFYNKVMFEGGRLAAEQCDNLLTSCDKMWSENILTDAGICLKANSENELLTSSESQIRNVFIEAKTILNVSLSLKSEKSKRLGHPVLSLDHWGQSYFCDSQWRQSEAQVMCRELGFDSGVKFYKQSISKDLSLTYAPFIGKFHCNGDEKTLNDCQRTALDDKCEPSEDLSLLLCDTGSLDGVHRKTKVRGFPFIENPQREEYFCSDAFENKEASVFCKMLGWRHGRSLSAPQHQGNKPGTKRTVSCQGEEYHLLDCKQINTTQACQAAFIECDPGFPLTLRLQKTKLVQEMFSSRGLDIGYPVIDTTENIGLFCSGGTNTEAVTMICKMLGYNKVSRYFLA